MSPQQGIVVLTPLISRLNVFDGFVSGAGSAMTQDRGSVQRSIPWARLLVAAAPIDRFVPGGRMLSEMVEGFVAALSGGLATRAGEGAATAASQAWSSLMQTVRRRLGRDPNASDALELVERAPQDQDARVALRDALLRVITEDPEFAQQFQNLWQRVQVHIHAEGDGVASQLTGSGGELVQAGRDVTINYRPLPDERATVPWQVQPFVGVFFNREDELAAFQRHLTDARVTGVTMVMLIGLPGSGRRALTSRVVALLGDRFPGGHVHINFAALPDDPAGLRYPMRW